MLVQVSNPCKRELRSFKVDRATNINKDLALGKFHDPVCPVCPPL